MTFVAGTWGKSCLNSVASTHIPWAKSLEYPAFVLWDLGEFSTTALIL